LSQEKKSKNSSTPTRNRKRTEAGIGTPAEKKKAGLEVRATAAKLLAAVVDRKISLDGILDPMHGNPAYKQLSDADRALTRAILLSALRHLPRIEAALGSLLETPLPEGARALQHVLAVAAAQILYLDVPPHAVVDLAVEQAQRDPRNRRFAKLVNAVLRRLVREKQAVLDRVATVSPAPEWFIARLNTAYGPEEAERITEAQLTPPSISASACRRLRSSRSASWNSRALSIATAAWPARPMMRSSETSSNMPVEE
jgi:16S rRNA (cytosine967-C5)-methyltransferase